MNNLSRRLTVAVAAQYTIAFVSVGVCLLTLVEGTKPPEFFDTWSCAAVTDGGTEGIRQPNHLCDPGLERLVKSLNRLLRSLSWFVGIVGIVTCLNAAYLHRLRLALRRQSSGVRGEE
jgi:hypothetical protein